MKNSIKRLLSKKKKSNSIFADQTGVILYNDAASIVYECSKSCYASKTSDKLSDKLKHVQARVNVGHESVTEHSNIVMLVSMKKNDMPYVTDCISGFKYLNVETSTIESCDESSITHFLIGGSTRAYKELIRSCSFPNHNKFILKVKSNLYECCYREFFTDMIEAGIMEDKFMSPGTIINDEWIDMENLPGTKAAEIQKAAETYRFTNPLDIDDERVSIINCDDVSVIYGVVRPLMFTLNQCMGMATVTVYFHNMSRIITQQLTRHRNAITQESQRYVDYSNKSFNSPLKFKPDKYNTSPEPNYYIGMSNSTDKLEGNIEYLGSCMVEVYKTLVQHGIDKEDARYLLPNGVPSNLYITFTYKNLIHFLDLRISPHAQAEIREYANIIDRAFRRFLSSINMTEEDLTIYTLPNYMIADGVVSAASDPYAGACEVVDYSLEPDSEETDTTENGKNLKAALDADGWTPSTYACTRENDKEIKIAESGKRDV